MSRPNEPVCARDILSWDESRLTSFLKACRVTGSRDLELSDAVTDVDRLSTLECYELNLKITTWVREQIALTESAGEEDARGDTEHTRKEEEGDEAESGPTTGGKHKGRMKRETSEETSQPTLKKAKTGGQQARAPQRKGTSSPLTAPSPRRSRRLAALATISSDDQKSTSN